MNLPTILAELKSERLRVNQVISALEAVNSNQAVPLKSPTKRASKGNRRHMSAAARKRMSAMMKARWASGKMKGRRGKAKAG